MTEATVPDGLSKENVISSSFANLETDASNHSVSSYSPFPLASSPISTKGNIIFLARSSRLKDGFQAPRGLEEQIVQPKLDQAADGFRAGDAVL